ncbi:MAG TPA: hypothetical protein VGS97_12035 [Actinocrinis sp.]|uniref:hypothetical protein n=1 Tax=Actinocrinis sp. TaxID=1920516 RepID=UPI002DDD0DA1|nr:hypothetical protein [Actinocrinis sp.]HEV2344815.1 hypothetical protein [Actinocrinis sp.]
MTSTDEFPVQQPEDPDRALARLLSLDALREQITFRRSEDTDRQCDAALRLLEWYSRIRTAADITALLESLGDDVAGRADRAIVLESVALGRPVDESAHIAVTMATEHKTARSEDVVRICVLVAAHHQPRDVARFVSQLSKAHCEPQAELVVTAVAERRSMDVVARLEMALRAADESEAASRVVMIALDRRGRADEIAELIDYQLVYRPCASDDASIGESITTHIRERMADPKLIHLILQQYERDPGRAIAWSASVAESPGRPIATIIALFARAVAEKRIDLADKITSTVGTHRGAEDLIAYNAGCADHGWDVFESLFGRFSVEGDPETMSDLVQLWNARHGALNGRLHRVLVQAAPAALLIAAAEHLAARTWKALADDLLSAALEQPGRFEPADVAALLGNVRKARVSLRGLRQPDIVQSVIRKLDSQLTTGSSARVNAAYLAGLSCAADDAMTDSRAESLQSAIVWTVFNKNDRVLEHEFRAALSELGRNDLAEKYNTMVAPLTHAWRGPVVR